MSEEMSVDTGAAPEEVVQPEGAIEGEAAPEAVEGEVQVSGLEGSEAVQENLETLQDQIQEAVDNGASKQEIKELIKEFELKVNGKTVKTKINLSDEEAVKRELQKAYAFNDVSQENAQIKKALSAKIAAWKSDPSQLFADLGVDATEFAVSHLDRQIEESKKTPEQREQEEKEKAYAKAMEELQAYKEREAKLKQMIEERRIAEEQSRLIENLSQEIDSALERSQVLAGDPEMKARLADMMAMYQDQYPDRDITAEMVLPKLEAKVLAERKKALTKVNEEELLSNLSEDQIKKLLEKHLKKNQVAAQPEAPKAPVTPSQVVPPKAPAKKEEAPKIRKSFEDVMRQR